MKIIAAVIMVTLFGLVGCAYGSHVPGDVELLVDATMPDDELADVMTGAQSWADLTSGAVRFRVTRVDAAVTTPHAGQFLVISVQPEESADIGSTRRCSFDVEVCATIKLRPGMIQRATIQASAHEIGHAFGLGHVTNDDVISTMHPDYEASAPLPTERDVSDMWALWDGRK